MKWIDSGDIKNWVTGKQRHCAQTLPELIRRLIFATASSIEDIEFPSGDSIATGGWDGRLKTAVIAPFFPSGASAWEIGIESSAGKKAEEDYVKRTNDPLGLTPTDTTFVFVTPRSWPGRAKWISDKRATSVWKDIRVINIDSLEQWLDSAPAVALWLAKQLGKAISNGIRGIENFWEEWSLATSPKMTSELVVGGRTRDLEEVQKWIGQKASILEVQGDSPDEAFAFLYAAIDALPDSDRVQALSRCIVVEYINELRACTDAFQNPLIIAAPGSCIEAAGAAMAKGHHVFLSMDAKVIDMGRILRLSRTRREVIEKQLHKNGLSEGEAEKIARDSGRSIPVLRRHLFRSKAVSAPTWANKDSAKILLPVLFAGSWSDGKEEDRKVIETLSELPYDNFIEQLTPFLSIDDSPLRKVGNVWMMKSPLDAWFLLARHLDTDSLSRFEKSIQAVLTKTDPKYDLPADKRWAAGIYGKSNPYSEWLRTGLVESLVLLAIYGDRSPNVTSTQAFADRVVKEIFARADKWEVWASLSDVSPLLAEASPSSFMEAVENTIEKNPSVLQELMGDDDRLWGECRHSGLLWALEGLGWSAEYLARTANILLQLSKLDKGGRWSNRAPNSLKDLFMPALPQTYATPEERLAVFDVLISKDHQTVWKFAQAYFDGGSMSESHRLRWRDAGGTRRGLEQESNEDYNKYVKGLFPKLSDIACLKENMVATMADFLRMGPIIQERLITALEKEDPDSFSKEEREKLLTETRQALNWINSFDGEKKYQKYRPGLFKVLERFLPTDALERNGWLLSNPWPRLPNGDQKDYHANDALIAKTREEAAREVLDKSDLEKVLDYAKNVQYLGVFGHAIGKVIRNDEEDSKILNAMATRVKETPGLIIGYALGRVEAVNKEWVSKQIKRMKEEGNYSPEIAGLLYLGLPEGPETWTAVDAEGEDVIMEYWKRARGYSRADKAEDAPIAVEKLLNAKRPAAALQVAGDPKCSIQSSLLKRLLQALLTSDLEAEKKFGDVMDEYHLGHVFNQIYERNELSVEEIARLEWPFGRLLKDIARYTSSPLAIYRALQTDPSFFVQLVTFSYKRDDHKPDPNQEHLDEKQKEGIAHNAWEILHTWHTLPGSDSSGTIDEKALTEWVDAVREQCKANGHVRGGDLQLAELLAHAPSDSDGVWPHIAVRNLIERLNSPFIDEHIKFGVFNSRGVVTRSLNDGGRQERELSANYKKMSDALKVKWPRTASILQAMSDWYESNAKQEDIESDLQDLRWS